MNKPILYILLLGLSLLVGCRATVDEPTQIRSAYYWSTVWQGMPRSKTFPISLNRLYIRYFDVVLDEERGPLPNATIAFRSGISDAQRVGAGDSIEVVPVVFIVNEVMKSPQPRLARLILNRVVQMNATNDIQRVHELQIDCDWTTSTRQHFYDMLQQLRILAAQHQLELSVTIRLHQLMQPAPPVDRGVLMMYNTGDFTQRSCVHPILDMRDAQPYLKYLGDYDLPLTAAYPLFAYRIAFRGNQYLGILHADDELPLLPGDTVITRKATTDEVLHAQQQLQDIRPEINREIIVFDISKNNLSHFKSSDYEKVYHQP